MTSKITAEDLIACGKSMGMNAEFCREILSETERMVSNWPACAEKCGIHELRAEEIQRGIRQSGLWER